MAIIHNYAPQNDHFLKMFKNVKMIYDDLLDFGVGNTKRMHTFIVIKDHKTLSYHEGQCASWILGERRGVTGTTAEIGPALPRIRWRKSDPATKEAKHNFLVHCTHCPTVFSNLPHWESRADLLSSIATKWFKKWFNHLVVFLNSKTSPAMPRFFGWDMASSSVLHIENEPHQWTTPFISHSPSQGPTHSATIRMSPPWPWCVEHSPSRPTDFSAEISGSSWDMAI